LELALNRDKPVLGQALNKISIPVESRRFLRQRDTVLGRAIFFCFEGHLTVSPVTTEKGGFSGVFGMFQHQIPRSLVTR
jgi:hypothetical protein